MKDKTKAFPGTDQNFHEHGMDLRDYFAAKAMQSTVLDYMNLGAEYEVIARESYRIADAMMEAREK